MGIEPKCKDMQKKTKIVEKASSEEKKEDNEADFTFFPTESTEQETWKVLELPDI